MQTLVTLYKTAGLNFERTHLKEAAQIWRKQTNNFQFCTYHQSLVKKIMYCTLLTLQFQTLTMEATTLTSMV